MDWIDKLYKATSEWLLEREAFRATIIKNIKEQKEKKETIQKVTIFDILQKEQFIEKYWLPTLQKFADYWGEKADNWKERRHTQKVFNIEQRLSRRKLNEETNFWKKPKINYLNLEEFDKWIRNNKIDDIKLSIGIEKYNKMKSLWKNSSLYLQ